MRRFKKRGFGKRRSFGKRRGFRQKGRSSFTKRGGYRL